MVVNHTLRQASVAARTTAAACLKAFGFGGTSPCSLPLLAILFIAGAAASAAAVTLHRTFDCDGARNGALTCSGCSRQFARHSMCEACLAETLDVGPVCRQCQAGQAVGPQRSATCQPVCFYCLGCEQQPLEEMGGWGDRGVDTCRCDLSRLRRAFDKHHGRRSSNATAVADDLWDGRHGIMMIDRDENRTGIIDGCRLEVSCLKRGGRHVTTLLSSSCSTTPESRPQPPPTVAAAVAVAAAVLDRSSINSSGGSADSSISSSTSSSYNSSNNSANNSSRRSSSRSSSNNSSTARVRSAMSSVKPALAPDADGLTTDEPLAWPTKTSAQAAVTVPPPVAHNAQSGAGVVAAASATYNERTRWCHVCFVLLTAEAAALAVRVR